MRVEGLRILLLRQEVLVLVLASSYVQPHLEASGGLPSLWHNVAIILSQQIDSEYIHRLLSYVRLIVDGRNLEVCKRPRIPSRCDLRASIGCGQRIQSLGSRAQRLETL